MAAQRLFTTILIGSLVFLPGCIVQEIRDELKSANSQLQGVQERLGQLETTNTTLEATKVELANTNDLIQNVRGGLTDIDSGLNRIDSTNSRLSMLEKQLVTLDSINKSMVRLDGHLSSLRHTISKLDTALPFFDLGGTGETIDSPTSSEPPTAALLPTDTDTPSSAATDPEQAATGSSVGDGNQAASPALDQPSTGLPEAKSSTTAQRGTPSKPDSMIGTWLSSYPDRGAALILLPTQRYHLGKPQSPDIKILGKVGQDNPNRIETGTWKREDKTLIFTPDSYEIQTKDGVTQTIKPEPWKLTVLSQLGRSSSTQYEDLLVIWNRP